MVDEKLIGKTYGPIDHQIEEEEVRAFLEATDDENPFYTDTSDPVPDPIPPMFAVVYAREVIADAFFDDELALDLPRLVHGSQDFTFHEPVHLGETVTTEGRIADWWEKGDNEILTIETTSRVDGQTRTKGEWTFVIRGGGS